MKVTNMSNRQLGLPNGTRIAARGGVGEVGDDTWKDMKNHKVVKAWLDEGALREGEHAVKAEDNTAPAGPAPADDLDDKSKDELIAIARDEGVTGANSNWGEDTLREHIRAARATE